MPKRALQFCIVLLAAFTMLGAGNPDKRFDKIGHNLMCTCGCAEILLECNHVSCPDSPKLISALHSQLATGASDPVIFKFFEVNYGPTVLASPNRGGFDDLAWIMPFAFLALGLCAIGAVVILWKRRNADLTPSTALPATPEENTLRDRIRNETNYGE